MKCGHSRICANVSVKFVFDFLTKVRSMASIMESEKFYELSFIIYAILNSLPSANLT